MCLAQIKEIVFIVHRTKHKINKSCLAQIIEIVFIVLFEEQNEAQIKEIVFSTKLINNV